MPTYRLTYQDGSGQGVVVSGRPVTIGRNDDNVLPIKDDLLSRYHCVVEPYGEGLLRIRDLGSRNGTKVNGSKIQDQQLAVGDLIKIGTTQLSVEVDDGSSGEGNSGVAGLARAARGGGGGGDDDTPASGAWATSLRELIELLPPKGGADEAVTMIDGRGKPTPALAGESAGPVSLRLHLLAASKSRATDIHVEPKGENFQVRMRVDGQMVHIVDLPNKVGDLMFGLIKTACQFPPAARDAVLDGSFSTRLQNRRVDYRVSFTPSMHGQKLVLRVLDQRDAPSSISDLDLPVYMQDRLRKVCQQDAGMLLVCGPTGSGKTTTLYNALREIDRTTRNVVTIEDPVEYHIEGVTQIPVDERQGNSFNNLLRSILRQDPDVLLVGEIRDEQTARTAMQAAMTGHLVFSTVHAKDTMASVFRLLDLKIEPYLVSNSLELVLAQRLARLLCDNCKRPIPVTPSQATRMGRFLEGKREIFVATGCSQCLRTGYRGRRAIFELLDFTDELRDVILKEPTITAMKKVIETGLFTTLVQSGWQLVARGVTTLDEIDRVASSR
jgi:general secretion pathway protein E